MKTKIEILSIALTLIVCTRAAAQETTAFTYQGQLRDNGTNANGTYTMTFKLYDLPTGPTNQFGNDVTITNTLVNGLFTATLDFGNVFTNGAPRWLEISVAIGSTNETLSPRVQILPSPYALYSSSAGIAATVPNASLSANNIASNQVVKSLNGMSDSIVLAQGRNVTLTTNGNVLQFSAMAPKVVSFTSSGTFTVPAAVTRILVEAWGGGGGGGAYGSQTIGGITYYSPGGGGAAGGYAMNFFSVNPGDVYSVVIGNGGYGGTSGNNGGNGGATSLGALISAGGGNGGGFGSVNYGTGGAGTSTSGSTAAFGSGTGQTGNSAGGGAGGSACRGGAGGYSAGNIDGGFPGGGGAGGFNGNSTGGSGANGLILIYY